MKKNEKLWIITELFYPDQTSTAYILKEISNFLINSREIEVICGPPNYHQDNNHNGSFELSSIKITRVKSFNLNKNKLLLRSLRLIILSIQLSIKYILKSNKKDKVLIVTNPAPLLLIFALISRISSRRIIVLVHDVFPENTIPTNIIKDPKSLRYKILKKIFDYAYSQFETLIVLGRDMKYEISKKLIVHNNKYPKIHIIENWADIEEVFPIKSELSCLNKWGISNKFIFLFAGNLGRAQALEEIFQIIKSVNNPLLHFVFLGEGALKPELIKFKESNNLKNITLGNSFHRDEQNVILNSCNIGLVTLAKGMKGFGVPSKSYNILAAGKPILYFGDDNSEISLLIKENKVGWNFNSDESMIEFLNNIDETFIESSSQLCQQCRDLVVKKYSKNTILHKFQDVL